MGDKVQSWLGQTGGSKEEVKSGLAGMLPGLVDKLTPDGGIPGMDQIGGMLKNLDLGKFLGGFGK